MHPAIYIGATTVNRYNHPTTPPHTITYSLLTHSEHAKPRLHGVRWCRCWPQNVDQRHETPHVQHPMSCAWPNGHLCHIVSRLWCRFKWNSNHPHRSLCEPPTVQTNKPTRIIRHLFWCHNTGFCGNPEWLCRGRKRAFPLCLIHRFYVTLTPLIELPHVPHDRGSTHKPNMVLGLRALF